MNKDDYMDKGSLYDDAPADSPEGGSSVTDSDYTGRARSQYRSRRADSDDDQSVGMRRRRRIRDMRPDEGPTATTDYRRERRGVSESYDSYRRRSSFSRQDRIPDRTDRRDSEPDTDYRARYKQRFESNRRLYGQSYADDRESDEGSFHISTDDQEERRPSRGRSSYRSYGDDQGQRRPQGSRPYRRDQGDRPAYGQRPRRSYNDQDGEHRGGRRPNGARDNRSRGGSSPRQFGGRQGGNMGKRKPARPTYDQPEISTDEPIRLNKFIANSGVCSRREADDLIAAGAVLVNGTPVTTLGTKVTINDCVEVNRQEVKPESKVYVLLNKPRNCVTTSDDPQERMTVVNLVRSAAKERIYPVGRLDRNTTGVLLLTNDGELAAKLVHPSFEKKKIYHAWLDKEVSPEDMQKLADGIELEDGEMHADAISYVTDEDHTQVGIEIHSGRNRIVRRLFEALGYRVVKLDRVYFAGLTKKNLGRGKWRYLTQEEVDNLKMGAFE